jgi:hypothetical protein
MIILIKWNPDRKLARSTPRIWDQLGKVNIVLKIKLLKDSTLIDVENFCLNFLIT